jgi:SAM-dependent methyltransferase
MAPAWAQPTDDGRLATAPAARNKQPILHVLQTVLPERGTVLEIASGTGQHVTHFAKALPGLQWQPSDPDRDMHGSIAAWTAYEGLTNVLPPVAFEVGDERWPLDRADAIICINMIHISPWQATLDLMRGAGRIIPPGGIVFLYGPYRRSDEHTAPSNRAFDEQLRATNPQWGIRDMEAVVDVASRQGFAEEDVVPMPANNFSLVLRKRA